VCFGLQVDCCGDQERKMSLCRLCGFAEGRHNYGCLVAEKEQIIQRLQNPHIVEILNQMTGYWTDFCHDAPLTLAAAEERERELQAQNPEAKFRVVPWFNSTQRQVVNELRSQLMQERTLSDKLAEALQIAQHNAKHNRIDEKQCWTTCAACVYDAALAEYAASRAESQTKEEIKD
jgi:hypothetical protein